MCQSRAERNLPEGVSALEATKLEHVQRPENARQEADASMEKNVAEKAKFYSTWTGQETLRDV